MAIIKNKNLLKGLSLLVYAYIFIYLMFYRHQTSNTLSKKLFKLDDSCSPVTNIAYLKTHKCASTSLQNALLRYGFLHNLTFALPKSGHHFGPHSFKASMIPSDLRNFEMNIFAIHTIWDNKEFRSVMPKDTFFLSAVREPSALFNSYYNYFRQSTSLDINEYIRSLARGGNSMTHDFGVQSKFLTNRSIVEDKIKEIDTNFDLILVVERLNESLILLRNKLCWTHRQVAVLKHNAISEKYKLYIEEDAAKKLRYLLRSDYLIYNHFVKKFDAMVLDFGKEKMEQEIVELQKATDDLKRICNLNVVDAGEKVPREKRMGSNKVNTFTSTSSDIECFLLESKEVTALKFVLEKQNKRLGIQKQKVSN